MSNNFFTHNDKPFAENINDGLLLSDAYDLVIPVSLPEHYSDRHFNSTTSIARKAGVALVTLLDVGSEIDIDDTTIEGSGDITFRVYPNFNQFYRWGKVGWTVSTGEVTVDLCKTDGTVIVANIPNGEVLSDYSELKKLQEIDVVAHFDNAVLSNITFYFENNHTTHSRPSALLQQANVEDLEDDLADRELLANKVSAIDEDSTHYPNCVAVADGLDLKEDKANKTTSMVDSDAYYPSSKAVYDQLALKENLDNKKDTLSDNSTYYPSSKAVYTETQSIRSELTTKEDVSNKTLVIDDYETHYPSNRAIYPMKQKVDILEQKVADLESIITAFNDWENVMARQGVTADRNTLTGIVRLTFMLQKTFVQANHDYEVTSVPLPAKARPLYAVRVIAHANTQGLTTFTVSSNGNLYVRRTSTTDSAIELQGSILYQSDVY